MEPTEEFTVTFTAEVWLHVLNAMRKLNNDTPMEGDGGWQLSYAIKEVEAQFKAKITEVVKNEVDQIRKEFHVRDRTNQ